MEEEATKKFLELAHMRSWTTTKAIGRQDYEEHWDWKLYKESVEYKVELKSIKRINSNDSNSTDELILIELQAVDTPTKSNRIGWLYGLADYICFEMKTRFVFVPRIKLKEYVESHIDVSSTPVLSNQNKKAHIIYTRKDRNDRFLYLYKQEILNLAIAIWRKDV